MTRYMIEAGYRNYLTFEAEDLAAARELCRKARQGGARITVWDPRYGMGKNPIVPKPLVVPEPLGENAKRRARGVRTAPIYQVRSMGVYRLTIEGPILAGRGEADPEADGTELFAGLAEAKRAACRIVDAEAPSRGEALDAKRRIRALQATDLGSGDEGATIVW